MMKDIKEFIKYIISSKLTIIGLIIYFLFNISALKTHWFDYFFFGSSIHYCCQGLDFYAIPNAAYAFFNGGDLVGNLPLGIIQYSKEYVTNFNVYHPLLTVILGTFFIQFNPEISIRLWIILKIPITLFTAYYIYKNFKHSKYLSFALLIFLINFSAYNDIKISQYQFLLNIIIIFFTINLVKNKNSLEGAFLYFLSLIVKPIGLIWIPVLLIKKKFSVVIIGLTIFAISTLAFKFIGYGDYYINNLVFHLIQPIPSKGIDFMSLDALLRNSLNISQDEIKILKYLILLGIYAISFIKSVNILKPLFLLIVFFLLFYDFVFQYHFSILGSILTICVLVLPEFQKRFSKILILIITFPNLFFLFKVLNYGIMDKGILGIDPTFRTWQIVSFFQLLPIVILAILTIVPEFKFYLNKLYKNK